MAPLGHFFEGGQKGSHGNVQFVLPTEAGEDNLQVEVAHPPDYPLARRRVEGRLQS